MGMGVAQEKNYLQNRWISTVMFSLYPHEHSDSMQSRSCREVSHICHASCLAMKKNDGAGRIPILELSV